MSKKVFVSTVLANFARANSVPASATGELRMACLLRDLFLELDVPDTRLTTTYIILVLKHQEFGRNPVLPQNLAQFLDEPTPPELLRKYGITPDSLVSHWNYDCLEDSSAMETGNVGASVECEHHQKWKTDSKKAPVQYQSQPVEPPDEFDSLFEL